MKDIPFMVGTMISRDMYIHVYTIATTGTQESECRSH